MKTLFRILLLAFLPLGFGACEDDHSYFDDTPKEIAYSEIAGCWQLTQWNGSSMDDSRYLYITLDRKERTFEIYQNFDSAKSRRLTGIYTLGYDENEGNSITGIYDHASGNWNHDYLIGIQSDGSMIWTAKDDAMDISVYTRCNAVPEDIINGTRSRLK